MVQHSGSTRENLKHVHRAFTLIELLVVIAIISLLVSILLPSLSRAKDLAKTVLCASNFRQVAIAEMTYQSEYDEYHVPFVTDDNHYPYYVSRNSQTRWFHLLEKYTETYDVFNCPVRDGDDTSGRASVMNTKTTVQGLTINRGESVIGATCNTAYTVWVGGKPNWGYRTTELLEKSLKNKPNLGIGLGNIITFADGQYWTTKAAVSENDKEYNIFWPQRYVHNGNTMNAAFLDGHVRSLTREGPIPLVYNDWAIVATDTP